MARLRRFWLRLVHAFRPSRGDADVAREVDTKDVTTIALTAIVVIATTVVAAYVPSRRAARVNPVDVLRTE